MLSLPSVHFCRPRPFGRARFRPGFTLIELMIVVGIVAILAAIAYPSYQSQIRKTRRGDAQAVLMQAAQFMERIYTENGCYDENPCDSGTATVLPFTKSPIDGAEAYYVIALKNDVTADTFTITATPQGSEVGAGDLSIDNTGTRTGW
ncbi:type IV pilin protein [Lamprocystis purpurea]|jgi:type IV pilus assembly protein PilE|uniref:type IV pilin protein n=1 Tax=Lamprocystis purpurea TaxID=61598 RepID=UPI0009FE939F|nr:type IV pilin protein [Lamprocystis purpurea]